MKKFLKACLCFVLVTCAALTFVGCSKKDVEEGTEAAIETATSIIPVEYTKETAQGILMTAYQKLMSTEKVNMKGMCKTIHNGIYTETKQEETVVYKNNSRYFYVDGGGNYKYIVGKYEDKNYCLNVTNKTAQSYAETVGDDIEGAVGAVPAGVKADVMASFSKIFSDVVSGRYYDGVTYINIVSTEEETITYYEVKIVDGNIVEMTSASNDSVFNAFTFTYGDAVDASVIPDTLDGYTKSDVA